LSKRVGRESTSILLRDDHGILDCHAGNSLPLADAAQETASLALRLAVDATSISYDKFGLGQDFRNHLVKHGLGEAFGYAGCGRSQDRKGFANLRTEAAWKLRRRLDHGRHLDDRYPTSS